jgi:putative hydroxymethylpyrimidine transport system substrate-binding protein
MLINHGAKGIEDIQLVSFEIGLTEAMLNGSVDAIMTPDWPHAQAEADNQGQSVSVLAFKGFALPEFYEYMLVASDKSFKKREDMVRRFTRAIRRGYEDALADPQAGIDALQSGTAETIDETLERPAADLLAPLWGSFRAIRGKRVPLIGDQDVVLYQTLIRWMRKNQLVGSKVHYQSAFHNKFSLIEE